MTQLYNIWSKNNKIYYLSKDQYIKSNSGKPLDYTRTIQVPIMIIIMVELKQFMIGLMFFLHCMLLKLKVMDLI